MLTLNLFYHQGDFGIDESDLGNYKLGKDVEATVGEGDTLLSDLIDNVVVSMKESERCYVNSKVNSKGCRVTSELDQKGNCLKFNVFLKSFSRAADIADLEPDEKLDYAEHQKQRAVELYQADRLEFSKRRFYRALQNLNDMESVKTVDENFIARVRTLTCQCHLNLAAVYTKMNQLELVLKHSTSALELDPKNVKGLFRRGQALMQLNKYDEAMHDMVSALGQDRNNKAIATQIRTISGLINKEKEMYVKMFSN